MKHFILLVSFLSAFQLMAQNQGELVIFSNLGEKFYVILNGIQQNQTPESHVKIEGLTEGWYSCRVLSENNLFSLTQNVGVGNNVRATYHIINKKGEHKLRYYSESPINTGSNEVIPTVVYHSEPLSTTGSSIVTETTTTQTTTTTTSGGTSGTSNTSTQTAGNTESVNINIGMSATGVSTQIDENTSGTTETVNVNIGMTETGMSTQVSETGWEESNETMNVNMGMSGGNVNSQNSTYSQTTTTTTTTTTSSQTPASTTNAGAMNTANCMVDNEGMTKVLSMVKNESFSENKMRVAKQFTKNKCLTVNQVRQIADLFSFSEDKMDYIKFAYTNCMNKQDYYELMEAFTFSDDKEELEQFLNSH